MNLTTATPVEIDTELARLDGEFAAIYNRLGVAINSLHQVVGDRKRWIGRREEWQMTTEEAIEAAKAQAGVTPVTYLNTQAEKALDRFEELTAAMAANLRESGVLEDEYNRRPWTRAFLAITNGQGHVHSSMNCSTCNNGISRTRFGWQPQYSGADEATIIADAGYRACTVCYPNAPVGDAKSLPTKMFTQDEITAQKAREEREAAKAARDAKKLAAAITPDGSELKITDAHGHREYFKTERAATTWLVQSIGHHRAWGYTASPEAERTVIEAIAAKHGKNISTVETEIEVKVIQWIKRNA